MTNKTPLQTSMGIYLTQNRGLRQDPVTVGNISAYRSLEPVASYRTMATATSGLGESAAAALLALKSANLYPLLDTDPNGASDRFTDITESHMNQILPADLTIFTQVYGIASAGVTINNSLIESNAAINTTLASTFTTMDDLTTGGFSQVSTDLESFGNDLANIGTALNLQYLDRLGQPSLVVASLKKAGQGYTGFREQMIAAGLTNSVIDSISLQGSGPGLLVESQIYQAMKAVIDSVQLNEILSIIGCTVSLTSLDQILDLKILLPTSYPSLQAPTDNGDLYTIYNGSGLNGVFNNLGQGLGTTSTTPELAASAKALAKGLRLVKNINGKTTGAIASTIAAIETSSDLADISGLTQPMPDDASSLIGNIALGSGANSSYVIADAIGSVAGYDFDPLLPLTVANITTVQDSGLATTLYTSTTGVFPLLTDVINGVYGSNPDIYGGLGNTLPAWITSSSGNSYGTIDAACIALAPDAQTTINSITSSLESTYGNAVATANSYWTTLGNRISLEKSVLNSVGVDLANLSGESTSLAISWADGVGTYAIDTQPGGASEFITKIANTADISGQTVVASLREQRTMNALQNLGTPPDSNNA